MSIFAGFACFYLGRITYETCRRDTTPLFHAAFSNVFSAILVSNSGPRMTKDAMSVSADMVNAFLLSIGLPVLLNAHFYAFPACVFESEI